MLCIFMYILIHMHLTDGETLSWGSLGYSATGAVDTWQTGALACAMVTQHDTEL